MKLTSREIETSSIDLNNESVMTENRLTMVVDDRNYINNNLQKLIFKIIM